MTLQIAPAFIGTAGYQHPVELMRNLVSGLFGSSSGLVKVGDFALTPTLTNQELSIAAGKVFLQGIETNTQGGYFAWNNAAQTILFAPPSGLPRIDTLVVRVIDTTYGSDPTTSKALFEIIQGAPSASPQAATDASFAPAAVNWRPGAWFRLADVQIDPGAGVIPTNKITKNLRYIKTPNVLPKLTYTKGIPSGTQTTTSSSSVVFTVIPTLTFTKLFDDTSLLIEFATSSWVSGTATNTKVGFNLRINTVIYETSQLNFNAASEHHTPLSSGFLIPVLAAGTYIAEPMFRRVTGAGVSTVDVNDTYVIKITELNS